MIFDLQYDTIKHHYWVELLCKPARYVSWFWMNRVFAVFVEAKKK